MKAYFHNLPIRIKFVVPMVAALAGMLVSVLIYLPAYHRNSLTRAYTLDAIKTAELFSAAVSHALSQHSFELLQRTLQSAKIDNNIAFILLFDENGEELASYNPQDRPYPDIDFSTKPSAQQKKDFIMVSQAILDQEDNSLGKLLLGFSLQNLNRQVEKVRIATILFAIGSFIFGLFFINTVSKRITRSISQLRQQMQENIHGGSYASDVSVLIHDEVGKLAEVFNKMMKELRSRHQSLVESRKRYQSLNKKLQELNRLKTMFVSDVSHNLRTPFTIIKGEIDVTLQRERTPAEYQEVLRIIEDESAHLIRIVENLLTLAKADTGRLVSLQDGIDFSTICRNQIKQSQALARAQNIHLQHEIAPNCVMRGDPARLGELIFNLLENAVKYTPPGKSIKVTLERMKENLVLKVTDTGIGLPESEVRKIFNRFYRGKHPSIKTKGSGLGLAICESIVEAHGGKISVNSIVGEGSTFTVQFKVFKSKTQKSRKIRDLEKIH
ncbi:MAG: sensor histidine kinase [bacterium]